VHQPIDPLAEVDRLDRHQQPHLRGDLQHHRDSRKLRTRDPRSGT
jgi:hypothetical protein